MTDRNADMRYILAQIQTVTEARNAYPRRLFMLPTAVLNFYDDPEPVPGDDGYTIDELVDAIGRDGQQMEVHVGFSVAEITERQNHKIYVFNGNHRLAACQRLAIKEMLCDNSPAEDAEPLTIAQITKLGGRLL